MSSGIVRVPWGDFPAVIANDRMGTLRWDTKDVEAPEYEAAKRKGDWQAALKLIRRKLRPDTLDRVQSFLENACSNFSNLEILPIDAIESAGNNKIPLAIAKVISDHLGGVQINTDIKQADKVGRTGAGINHRLAFMPSFVGTVHDKQYFIVDDTLRVGGTIANLRGFIDSQGGKTVGAFVMQSDEQSLILHPSEKTYRKLYTKHGMEESDEFCQYQFGFDTKCLTRGEAGNIAAAASLADIRERISAAREEQRRTQSQAISLRGACETAEIEIARERDAITRTTNEIERITRTRGQAIDRRGGGSFTERVTGTTSDVTGALPLPPFELAMFFSAAAKSGAAALDAVAEAHSELTGAITAYKLIARDDKFRPDWGPDNKERLQLATEAICSSIGAGTLQFDDDTIERIKLLSIQNQDSLDNER